MVKSIRLATPAKLKGYTVQEICNGGSIGSGHKVHEIIPGLSGYVAHIGADWVEIPMGAILYVFHDECPVATHPVAAPSAKKK